MARGQRSVGAAVGAALLLGGAAFTAGPAGHVRRSLVTQQLRGAQASSSSDSPHSSASAWLSLSALALGGATAAVWGCNRRGRISMFAEKVTTLDDAGRVRFAVAAEPVVPSEQPGITAPLGFFDPLGFSKDALMTFRNDPSGFYHLRAAEIKHGRVAMMAATGSVFAHYVKFPTFDKVPSGLAALTDEKGATGFGVLLILVGLVEAISWKASDKPGNFGDPFKWGEYTPEMRTKELNNGRMAMFAIMGQIVAEMQTGLDPVEQFSL